ncbi:hypothetical protein [Vitiosangium sp. GDMCC 1.1324]|uniref:hypothetical protein n=1 Tax=Vitiosangium sp. (strain GDMCC 1.1324) TaxID=2138576 RepID=UPI000D3B182C|nr:hypothetical protein [Vitiosangium sp. GDMCC 1.1324]PTL79148.1 hypothetical protein DAT35_36740 [Vitiosangium sp. GDMCC 1.1324]
MSSSEYALVVNALRARVQAGLSMDESIVVLQEQGVPIVPSMKAVMDLFGVSLDEAKQRVAGHPVWAGMSKASEPLHDALELLADAMKGRPFRKAHLYRAAVTALFPLLGLEPIAEDWSGLDAVLPLIERMRQDGAVVMVKWDGERKAPGDAPPYTVLASVPGRANMSFRADLPVLEDALARVIVEYAVKAWNP